MSMQTARRATPFIETADCFAADVAAGLTATPKRLPPKYFYDAAGSALFDSIIRLPDAASSAFCATMRRPLLLCFRPDQR
jgi:L-histidine N-alpha-methyltransferase